MGAPGPHPGPPQDLHERKLLLAEQSIFYRSYRHASPLHFGRSGRNRFDDPKGIYSVLYAAANPRGAFIETFGQATGKRTISTGELRLYRLAHLASPRKLLLADLTAPGALARIGADSRLFSGEHSVAQQWSRAFFEHVYTLDGIFYPARHDHTQGAFAIFNRAPELEIVESFAWHGPDADRSLLAGVLDAYGFDLIETVIEAERKWPGRATDSDQTSFDF